MSTKTTTESSAATDEANSILLLEQAGYHVASLMSGGYVVIDLADMSTTAECRDLSELMDLSQERKEEIIVPQRLAPKETWPNDRTPTEIPMAPVYFAHLLDMLTVFRSEYRRCPPRSQATRKELAAALTRAAAAARRNARS